MDEEGTATRHNEQSRLALEPIKPQSERNSRSREELSSLGRHSDQAARKGAMQGVSVRRRGLWSVVEVFGAEEEKAGRFRVKVSVSAGAWLALGFWGKRGAAEQGRTGLGWARAG